MIAGGWDIMERKGRCYNARRSYRFTDGKLSLIEDWAFWPGVAAPTRP